ncbi:MAG TPA: septum formation initiator family protein [Gemmatimonadaceae bacterium]|nr:septum formation initiator family protein [Gemmatimonadaceae bacterium]
MARKIVWGLLIAFALFFAIQGGEYSTRDLFVLHRRTATIGHEVDSLKHHVDSLTRFLRLVKSDSATMERLAREEFGMVRGDKEILYRFGEARDTADDRQK